MRLNASIMLLFVVAAAQIFVCAALPQSVKNSKRNMIIFRKYMCQLWANIKVFSAEQKMEWRRHFDHCEEAKDHENKAKHGRKDEVLHYEEDAKDHEYYDKMHQYEDGNKQPPGYHSQLSQKRDQDRNQRPRNRFRPNDSPGADFNRGMRSPYRSNSSGSSSSPSPSPSPSPSQRRRSLSPKNQQQREVETFFKEARGSSPNRDQIQDSNPVSMPSPNRAPPSPKNQLQREEERVSERKTGNKEGKESVGGMQVVEGVKDVQEHHQENKTPQSPPKETKQPAGWRKFICCGRMPTEKPAKRGSSQSSSRPERKERRGFFGGKKRAPKKPAGQA